MPRTVKSSRMSFERLKELLAAGIKLRIISEESGYPISVIGIMARAWGFEPRKRGPKPGTPWSTKRRNAQKKAQ